jgi:hypothetical protein
MQGNISLVKDHPAVAAFYGCDDCCHMDVIAARGMAEMQEIAKIKREIFQLDPYHLIWGSIACREIWMWSDESGNGLGLDVTMKEAYSSGVGDGGLTVGPRPTMSEATLRDWPMTMAPLVHMPNPMDMASPAMMRAHAYTTLCHMDTFHLNHFVFNNNQFFDVGINAAVDAIAREMVELLPAVLSRRHIAAPGTALRPPPVVTLATATPVGGGDQRQLSARIWEEEEPPLSNRLTGRFFCARLVVVNSDAFPVLAQVDIGGLPSEIVNAWRMFHAVYVSNLTKTAAGSTLHDMLDGDSANVYQLGCREPPCSSVAGHCANHPATDDGNLVQNGQFEEVEVSRPTQLVSQTGDWHVFAPDGPGFTCTTS